MLFSWHCALAEPSGEQLHATTVARRCHTTTASPVLRAELPSPVPRQPLAEKPKKPCSHLSQRSPVTPGWQEHCPVTAWHPLSWDPIGWHSQLCTKEQKVQ